MYILKNYLFIYIYTHKNQLFLEIEERESYSLQVYHSADRRFTIELYRRKFFVHLCQITSSLSFAHARRSVSILLSFRGPLIFARSRHLISPLSASDFSTPLPEGEILLRSTNKKRETLFVDDRLRARERKSREISEKEDEEERDFFLSNARKSTNRSVYLRISVVSLVAR